MCTQQNNVIKTALFPKWHKNATILSILLSEDKKEESALFFLLHTRAIPSFFFDCNFHCRVKHWLPILTQFWENSAVWPEKLATAS